MKSIITLVSLLIINQLSLAQPGTLDKSFGDNGTVLLENVYQTNSMALQKGGKIVTTSISDIAPYNNVVIRFNEDGTLDKSFGDSGFAIIDFDVNQIINALVIQDDNKILVVGYGSLYVNSSDPDHKNNFNILLARLLPDGGLDSTFGTNGQVNADFGSQEYGQDLKLQADGKIVVAGSSSIFYGDFLVARYMPDGSVDSSFGSSGITVTEFGSETSTAYTAAIQQDGKIVLGGSSFYILQPANLKSVFARYLPNGRLDASFGTNGKQTIDVNSLGDGISEVEVNKDGDILACGSVYENYSGERRSLLLLSLNTNGSLNANFGNNGKVVTDFGGNTSGANAMAIQQNGKIIAVCGFAEPEDIVGSFLVSRFLPDGSTDSSFGTNGKQTTSFGIFSEAATDVAILNDGKIITCGALTNSKASPWINYLALARYNGDRIQPSLITKVKRFIKKHLPINIYPNPVKDVLTIRGLNANTNTTLTILNAQGFVAKRIDNVKVASLQINVSQLPKGTYYLQAEDETSSATEQFYKE